MFAGNKLQAFTIPSTVTKIVNYAFDENLLTSLVIPETITSIGRNAFANNLLTSAVFQGNAPEEGSDVFEGNAGLMWLDVPPISTGWSDYWSDVPIRRVAKAFASTRPSIGNAVVYSKGISILTARKGIWTGSPTPVISYQWYACTKLVKSAQTTVPKSCKKISKATSSVHKFARTSKGEYLSVAVTGKSGATSATMWLSRSTELKYQLLK
jgi:hypothetical protein